MQDQFHSISQWISQMGNVIMPFVFVVFLYIFAIRPQHKKEKQRQSMLDHLKRGDHVMTSAGIKGTVDTIQDGDVVVTIAKDIKVVFSKSAIVSRIEPVKNVADSPSKKSERHRVRRAHSGRKKQESSASKDKPSPSKPKV